MVASLVKSSKNYYLHKNKTDNTNFTIVKKILSPKEAEKIQNEIFRKMPVKKKIKLALDFSAFCLKLRKENFYGDRKLVNKSSQGARKS